MNALTSLSSGSAGHTLPMHTTPFHIIALLTAAGLAGAGAVTGRRGWQAARGLWLKFVGYICIVTGMTLWFAYLPDLAWLPAGAIAATGLAEILRLHPATSVHPGRARGLACGIYVPLATGLAALAGDLLAARYKRLCGVKDYGRLIPAHGGMLDRFNGFIGAGAFWALALLPHATLPL